MVKISVIGAGVVGSQVAFLCAEKKLADVVLVDVVDGFAEGKALDIFHSLPILGSDVKIVGSANFSVTEGSDVVVVTAGSPRKQGMSRDDLVEVNSKILRSVVSEVVRFSPDCILIVVTNPVNVLSQLAFSLSGFFKNRIIGFAGVLDSSRFRAFVADELKVSSSSVEGFVFGDHGDLMVPVVSSCKVNNRPLEEFLSGDKISSIVSRTRDASVEIIRLTNQSTCFAPAVGIVEILDCIINDKKKVLPCSVFLQGEYNLSDVFVGVPVVLGKRGVEKIIELSLSDSETKALKDSSEHIKEMFEKV